MNLYILNKETLISVLKDPVEHVECSKPWSCS